MNEMIESSQARVQRALTEALSKDGATLITRWVLCVETFDSEGKSMEYVAAPDMASWEIVGMAEMASEAARIQFTSNIIDAMYEGDDEDEDEE